MIKVNDRFMTGAMYAPFCRTKHAPMDEWDKDMKNMAELGYTCLHGFGTILSIKKVYMILPK